MESWEDIQIFSGWYNDAVNCSYVKKSITWSQIILFHGTELDIFIANHLILQLLTFHS